MREGGVVRLVAVGVPFGGLVWGMEGDVAMTCGCAGQRCEVQLSIQERADTDRLRFCRSTKILGHLVLVIHLF